MDQQSKQGHGKGKEGKRKADDDVVSGSNGSNGHDDFPAELAGQVAAAADAEKVSVEKGIDAWKKVVAAAPQAWAPKRELARVYKKAERWNAFIEVMKDAVDKANWASPDEKIPLLFEMIEVYRDRLKLDVMVVNAFNQILNIQPANVEAGDALAAQYEGMKRWPDLISLLRKKAGAAEELSEKVALHLKVANLFLEKFSNQAEAIKAFETILELDPKNVDALAFLKQMYEKRRDWEKLVAVTQREIELSTDEDAKKLRRVEVAKLASEKLKKPSVSIDLWKQVLAGDADNAEALGELEKLYEREKAWGELGDVLQRQVSASADATKKSALLVKLGILYTEKVQDAGKATTAWQALLQQEPDNRRAQDALKKLYLVAKDWNALEAFYAGQNKWDELVRVLERQAETDDGPAAVSLWNKIGELYRDRLNKPDRAQKAYEKALATDGQNLAAAEALIPLYEKSKDVRHLAEALMVQLNHTKERDDRLARIQRLSQLLEGDAGDKGAALTISLMAFTENPVDAWAQQTSRRLAGESRRWSELVEAYEAALPKLVARNAESALAVLATLAHAYEKELANPESAIARNQTILESVPKDPEAVGALERLYVATGRFADLLAIYDKKLELAKSKAEELDIRFKLAGLYEDEIRQPEKAVELYTAILKQEPTETRALGALDRLYLGLGRWKELASTIEKEIVLASGPAVADLKFRLGAVLEQHLGDEAGAVGAYRMALSADIGHAGARTALQAYLSNADADLQMAAVQVLEPIYEQTNELPRLVEVERIKLGREKVTAKRVASLLRIGGLEGKLGNAEQAWDAYARAFTESPDSQAAREALENLASITDAWQPLVSLYEKALAASKAKGGEKLPSALERELLLVVAVAYDEKLGASEKAVEFFRRAQTIQPEDASALVALERLYTRTERWNDLVDTLTKKATLVSDVAEREQIRTRIATVWEEMLGNVDQAVVAWNVVLADNPRSVPSLRALDRLYQAKGDWRDLADNLAQQLSLTSDAGETIALLGRLGALREQRLGEMGGAVETYRKILAQDPDHAETLAALERILPDPRAKEHELEVAQLLEPVYKIRGDWPHLIGVYEIEARHAVDPAEKINLLRLVADGHEVGMDDPVRAYEALGRALKEDPMHPEVQSTIERLARALGQFPDLTNRYGHLVGQVADPELKNALHHKIALLAEIELNDDAGAATAYAAALDVSPRDLKAANALEQLYLRSSDYPNLVTLLNRKADIVDDVAQKKALYYKAAQIHEEVLENLDASIGVFKQVLAVDDADSVSLDQLERLYIRLARWSDLKNIYSKKAELATNPAEKKQMLFVLGQVYDRELGDPERAIETYTSIMDIDPDDFDAAQALDRLYQQTARWYDLLAVLERQTELAPSPAEVVSLRFRIGELWREHLKDLTRAIEGYRSVLQMDPSHEPTLRALEALMTGPSAGEPVLAAQVLEPIYESAGEWERVIAVQEVLAANADEPGRKVEMLSRIAELEERRLSHQNAAFDAYARALHVDPSNGDVIAQLQRLAHETGHWPKLAALYAGELSRLEDPRQKVETMLRLAHVYEEETGQVDEAIATYRQVVAAESDNKEALVALDRLYSHAQRWEELADIIKREVRIAPSDEAIVALTYRLAQVYELALLDLPKAVAAYKEVLVADPTHGETRAALERMFMGGTLQLEIAEILEPLYRSGEEWEKLTQIYEVQLSRISEIGERQTLLRRLAEIAEQKLVDQVAAFGWWAHAVKEDPSSEQALDELVRLARATHQWDAYVQTMSATASPERSPRVRRDVLLRLAGTYETELGDLERAENALVQVLGENDKDPAALASLDRIYEAQGMYENLAATLRHRLTITDDTDEIVSLNLRLGRVHADALDDAEPAIASYNAVLEHQSRSAEALEALEKLYFRGEKWADLYGVYEKLVDVAKDESGMADCYARMAKLAAEALGQRDKAVELWGRVIDVRPNDPDALGGLADLHEMASEWKELTEVLEKQVIATTDPEAKIPVYKRLGRIWGEKLSRERNALESWQKVLELDPQDVDALRALAANYRSAGAWEELSQALRRLIQVGQLGAQSETGISQEELKELYAQLGELEGETLMRTQDSIDAWREVLELDASDFRALAALEKLFVQEARWEEAVDILERRARALATPTEQVDVLMQAASLWADKIGDGGSAAEVYERVLQLDPGNATASLELEGLYKQRKSWVKLVDLLLSRTQYTADALGRINLLVQTAGVYEQQLNDLDSAFLTLRAAFQEDYSNDLVAKELERLATAADKWNELIGEYTQLVQGIAEPKTAADLWVKIARWYDSALRHTDYAIASAQQALQLDNVHVGALQTLEDLFRKQKRWSDLVGALARHAEVEQEPTARVDILLQLADTYETQIGDTAQATFAYQRALDTDERCIDAISALERLYRRTQAWDRLVEVLTKKAHVVDDTEQGIKLRLQVGELWESRLGDNDRAIEAYKEVLSVDPQNLVAINALDVLFEKTGRMEEFLENLEHKLEVSPEGDRAGIYQEMASTWEEKFGKPERAAEVLEKVLLIEDRNQKAYRDLERLYRSERKWESLVDTYRKHILVTNDTNERIELLSKMGQVYEIELRDLDRAIDAFNDVLNVEQDHKEALAGLARLYEETEQWERAVDVMRRLISVASDPKLKVDLNYRLGKIFDEQMKDPEPAQEYLVEALSQDPAHVPSMLSLLGIYKRRGDWMKAAQLMVRAEAATVNTLEKARLLQEAAKIFQEKLGDDAQATDLYARVMQLDPEHVEAGEPLSELYFKREEWAPLVPILEMLARKADRKTNKELTLLNHRLAKAADKLGDNDKALKYYKQSYDLDSTFLPTLIDRAALLYKLEHWDDAFRIYQTILVHHREAQKDDAIVDIFYRLGRIKLKLGERTKAVNMLEKALEIQPGHRATLQALIDLYSEAGDFEAVIKQKRALLASPASDGDEKFKLSEEIAGIYKDKLNNPQKAIAANLEALTLRPNDHQLLHNLLDLFSDTKQWKKAMEILMKLAELEEGKVKARYLVAAGNIANYELHSTDEAVELYNSALDSDPDDLKAFERIDKILTAKKDWKNQERNYRKMIKRLGTEPPAERKPTVVALWHGLGEIYRSRLKDFKSATAAFEVCVQLDPDGIGRHQILAELYQLSGPDSYEKAVGAYRHLVKVSPDFGAMAVHMKTLRKLFTEMRQYDRAWCVTSALAFLRKADGEEQQFYEQYKPKGFARAKSRLTEELWLRNIYHPDEDRYVSSIFALVSQAVAVARAKEHKDWGLKRKDRRDVATDQLLFSKVFNYVNQVLGVPQPELYLRPESPGELDLANAREKAQLTPSFVVGANLLQGRPEKELAYVIGKKLTFMRADHFVRWPNVVPTVGELKIVFLAALRLVQPKFDIKPDLQQGVAQYVGHLQKTLPPQALEQLGVNVQRFIATKADVDLHKWSNAVDLTGTRAGLLMCNDLEVAARLAQAEPVAVGVVEPKEKIRDLILWSISDEYFTLREHLGLVIGQG
ncbi:MAG: Tetratricopeptide 2 repeat protein [Myxococcales bacterium]|nr:Tetratricopeptide 2 repeat protein [Myxococcales bacterium]